jgi:hypothetical protein
MTGHRPAIIHWYQPWGYTKGPYQPVLDSVALEAVAARGATPMITWEAWGSVSGVDPSRLRNIPTGAFDDYIDRWAHELRAFRAPVYLRLFHEMNNPRYPWAYGQNGNSAQDLIAAWRHVHSRFVRAGATNVQWVWSPNTENDLVSFSDIYPGDAYVDWFGVDGYNGGRELDWDGWRSPSDVFSRSFDAFRALSPTKPVMIAETSTVEGGAARPSGSMRSTRTCRPRSPHCARSSGSTPTSSQRAKPIGASTPPTPRSRHFGPWSARNCALGAGETTSGLTCHV